jgi:ribosomal protein S18 acetylase RimI-like enzyme
MKPDGPERSPNAASASNPNRDREAAVPRPTSPLAFRTDVAAADDDHVRRIVRSTGFFSDVEVEIAVELVLDRLSRGDASDYHFLFASSGERVIAYACYGPIAGTRGSHDLYWIAVDREHQGRGIGVLVMTETERHIARAGGQRVFIDTSARPQYAPTRAFYERCGYRIVAELPDFYAVAEAKVIFARTLNPDPTDEP